MDEDLDCGHGVVNPWEICDIQQDKTEHARDVMPSCQGLLAVVLPRVEVEFTSRYRSS